MSTVALRLRGVSTQTRIDTDTAAGVHAPSLVRARGATNRRRYICRASAERAIVPCLFAPSVDAIFPDAEKRNLGAQPRVRLHVTQR